MEPRNYTYAGDVLHDRIVLITGASDGIGRALALHAAELGARVILHGRNVKKLEEVYDAIESRVRAPRPADGVVDRARAKEVAYEKQ
ncbi:MAG: SDR family NAD(P)-dependent oxidoreductase, partial [Woeseiaceae bacterium]|nr:SDR family NAD(P)-dependent oxidoreductase [Woeseiaceae bacterium]